MRRPGAGAHLVEEGAGPTERQGSAGVADCSQAAALAEKGMGLFGQLRELLPTVRGIGVEGSGLGLLAGAFCLNRPDGDQRMLLPREDVGNTGGEAGEQVVVLQGVGGSGKPGEMVAVLGMVVARRVGDDPEQLPCFADSPG